ncbi:hypothetical protein KMI_01g01880 [Encephalitozoon hellem]|nr:hypothetical protein KMI_01g01880 [Encephalitozoon hellem]
MGARRNRMRGRGRILGLGKNAVQEVKEIKKEEKQEGKFNVDFQELSRELSTIELKEENEKCSDGSEEIYMKDSCVGDRGEQIGEMDAKEVAGESVNVSEEESKIVGARDDVVNAARMPQALHSVTPNVLTTVIPQTPVRRVLHEEGSNLLVKEEGLMFPSKMIINRYPGHLFIHIDEVERFMTSRKDVESVSIKIESKETLCETKRYPVQPDVGINEMLRVPISRVENGGMPLRFILLLHHKSGRVTKSCETVLTVDSSRIRSVHNNLLESRLGWDNYVSRNLFKSIKSFFTSGAPDAWSLKIYLSFISEDELRLIPAPLPQDLKSLSKWLVVKKFSYNIWFRGFVNIRGDAGKACTNLWKRRYVRCYGYMIFVFNEHSRSLIGTISLVDACFDPSTNNKVYLENFLRISIGQSAVELHFDTKDKYNTCRNALTMMLPQSLFHKKE